MHHDLGLTGGNTPPFRSHRGFPWDYAPASAKEVARDVQGELRHMLDMEERRTHFVPPTLTWCPHHLVQTVTFDTLLPEDAIGHSCVRIATTLINSTFATEQIWNFIRDVNAELKIGSMVWDILDNDRYEVSLRSTVYLCPMDATAPLLGLLATVCAAQILKGEAHWFDGPDDEPNAPASPVPFDVPLDPDWRAPDLLAWQHDPGLFGDDALALARARIADCLDLLEDDELGHVTGVGRCSGSYDGRRLLIEIPGPARITDDDGNGFPCHAPARLELDLELHPFLGWCWVSRYRPVCARPVREELNLANLFEAKLDVFQCSHIGAWIEESDGPTYVSALPCFLGDQIGPWYLVVNGLIRASTWHLHSKRGFLMTMDRDLPSPEDIPRLLAV
jgi:hypothetical protein